MDSTKGNWDKSLEHVICAVVKEPQPGSLEIKVVFVSVQSVFLRDYQSHEEEVIRKVQDLAQWIVKAPLLSLQGWGPNSGPCAL